MRRWRVGAAGVGVLGLVMLLLIVPVALAFVDVPPSHPNAQAIETLVFEGVISGYTDGSFGPGNPILRAQFAKMATIFLDLPVSEENICSFSDVERSGGGSLYPDNYVAMAAQASLTQGFTASTFGPYQNISRAQVATMVIRAADAFHQGLLSQPPVGWSGRLPSSDPTHGQNLRRAEYNGLLDGLNPGSFGIWDSATRAEVAQILVNLQQKILPPIATDDLRVTTVLPAHTPLVIATATAEATAEGGVATVTAPLGPTLVMAGWGEDPYLFGVREVGQSELHLDEKTTAEALVLYSPAVISYLPDHYAAAVGRVRAHSRYAALKSEVNRIIVAEPASLTRTGAQPVLSNLVAEIANSVTAHLKGLTNAAVLQDEYLNPLAATWLTFITVPDHPFKSLLGTLRVIEGDALRQVETQNELPVAFEGTIRRADTGEIVRVPVVIAGKTLGSMEHQLVLPRNPYSQDVPRTLCNLDAEVGVYTFTYSPSGDLAMGYNVYLFATELVEAFVGTLPKGEVNAKYLLALSASQAARDFTKAVTEGDATGVVTGLIAVVESPEFASVLSASTKGAVEQFRRQLGKSGFWTKWAGKACKLVSGTKFVFDNVLRFGTLADVWLQETRWGSQTWTVEVRDATKPVDKWKKSSMTPQELLCTILGLVRFNSPKWPVSLPSSFPHGWAVAASDQRFKVEYGDNLTYANPWAGKRLLYGYEIYFTDGQNLINWQTTHAESSPPLDEYEVEYGGQRLRVREFDGQETIVVEVVGGDGGLISGKKSIREAVYEFAAASRLHLEDCLP